VFERIKGTLPEAVKNTWRKSVRRLMPSQLSNVDYNRALWDRYAKHWQKESVTIENASVKGNERDSYIQHLGDEWGRLEDVEKIVAEYIFPYINAASVAAEIGSGGGRIASRVAPLVAHLYCFDISEGMLRKVRDALAGRHNVDFVLLQAAKFPANYGDTFDFVYSFDVFVHLDLHTIWKYFREIRRVLKPGGRTFLHTANLLAPGGWEAFSAQEAYDVEGHYFISPEIVSTLAQRSGLNIIKTSKPDAKNFYSNRDYLFILEKPLQD
jgi:SAM-dependent methyltransferase